MRRDRETRRRGRRRRCERAARLAAVAAGTLVLSTAASEPLSQSGLGAYITIATDARKRGLSQVHDEAAVRAGLDYEHVSGLYAGSVLGNVAFAESPGRTDPRDRVLELYAGYVWRGSRWSISTTLGHYRYPGTPARHDYDELSLVVDYDDRYFYRASYSDDLLGSGHGAAAHEIGLRLPLPGELELGASVGRVDFGSPYVSGYTHYDAGLSRLFGRFGLDLRRYGTSRTISGYYGSSAGERWALSLSYAIRSGP